MTARSAQMQQFQIGKEATPGTAVAANKRLVAMGLKPKASLQASRSQPLGYLAPVAMALNAESTEAEYSGLADYNALTYVFCSLLGAVTPTQPDATNAPTAYRWTWDLTGKNVITPQTYTMEYGDAGGARKFAYGIFNSLELTINKLKDNEMSGDVIGRALQTGVSLTASPTDVPAVPIAGAHWNVSYAASGAGLNSGTQLLDLYEAKLSFADLFTPAYPVNRSQGSFDTVITSEDVKLEWEMTLGADSVAEQFLTQYARLNKPVFFRLDAVGGSLGGTITYKLQIDIACFITEFDSYDSGDGVHVLPVSAELAYDSGWGKVANIQLTNTVNAL